MPTKEEILANLKSQAIANTPSGGLGQHFQGPPLDKGGMKEFMLRALSLAPQGIGAGGPLPVGGPITGGKNFQLLNEMSPTVVHNPNSATDLALKAPLQSSKTLGVPEGGSTTIPAPENANRYNPKVMDILDHLAGRNVPVKQIVDSQGGTTYIKAINPVDNKNMTIRVPDPDNPHFGRNDIIKPFINKNGRGSYFDVATKGDKTQKSGGGVTRRETTENESGQKYGEDIKALYDAIDQHVGLLSPPGRGPNYNAQSKVSIEPPKPATLDTNQLGLDLKPYQNMEQPAPPSEWMHKLDNAKNPGAYPEMGIRSPAFEQNPANFNKPKNVITGAFPEKLPPIISQETRDIVHKGLRAYNQKNLQNNEKPQLTTNEMKTLSDHIDDFVRNFKGLKATNDNPISP